MRCVNLYFTFTLTQLKNKRHHVLHSCPILFYKILQYPAVSFAYNCCIHGEKLFQGERNLDMLLPYLLLLHIVKRLVKLLPALMNLCDLFSGKLLI